MDLDVRRGASQQDDARIRELTGGLSQELHVAAIAFLVHDSDIACYWLYDDGRLLDEFNSCPNYFEVETTEDTLQGPSGGKPDVLVRYCRRGASKEKLVEILSENGLFAEDLIQQLAKALGIDEALVLADYRDAAGADGPEGPEGDDENNTGGVRGAMPPPAELAERLAGLFGTGAQSASVDPQVKALVQAAADGNTEEIDRLLASGVAINAEAPAPLPGSQAMGGLAQILPGGMPQIALSPLHAAVVHKRAQAVERLLAGGADPNRVQPLFGTPLHAATGAGEAALVELLLKHGGDVKARDARGQTPLQAIAAGRATLERLAQAQAMMKSMGMKLPGLVQQMSNLTLPTEGWEACERILKAHGAE